MSWVRGEITALEAQRSARRNTRRHTESLWSDAAYERFEDRVLDALEQQDRLYATALDKLDAAFDDAAKLLGPI